MEVVLSSGAETEDDADDEDESEDFDDEEPDCSE